MSLCLWTTTELGVVASWGAAGAVHFLETIVLSGVYNDLVEAVKAQRPRVLHMITHGDVLTSASYVHPCSQQLRVPLLLHSLAQCRLFAGCWPAGMHDVPFYTLGATKKKNGHPIIEGISLEHLCSLMRSVSPVRACSERGKLASTLRVCPSLRVAV